MMYRLLLRGQRGKGGYVSAQERPLRTRIRAQKIEGYGVAFHEYIQRHLRRDQLRS